MAIQIGQKIPACTIQTMGSLGPTQITTDEIFGGKKVLLFALPGAFTPVCSAAHLPGYVAHAAQIKAAGVDTIACMSVNDAFVMGAWSKDQNAEEILMLADGNGDLTEALGLVLDGNGFGMGKRSQRYAMIVEDGMVTHLNVEVGPAFEVSNAEVMMALL